MEWFRRCLEIHEKLGGRFQDWANVTPRHQAFINKILQSSCHVITTTRRKMDYSLDIGSNGKTKVVKHGTKEITRDGFEYELTINFELVNENHLAKASKDRTGLFMNKPEFLINSQTGKMILDWCNAGIAETATVSTSVQLNLETIEINKLISKIGECNTLTELLALYKQYPGYQEQLKSEYEARKSFLIKLSNPQNFSTNGVHR